MPIWEELSEELITKARKLGVDFYRIEEKFVRGSGKGGQKINKTSSAVWLHDLKTGIEVKVQKHREQSANRLSAYKLLITKIENLIEGEKSAAAIKIFKLRKQKKKRSKRAKEKMFESKRQRTEIKEGRRKILF